MSTQSSGNAFTPLSFYLARLEGEEFTIYMCSDRVICSKIPVPVRLRD